MAEDEDLELTDEEKEAIREARKARKEKERNAPVRVKEYEISRKDAIRKGIIEPDDDDDDDDGKPKRKPSSKASGGKNFFGEPRSA